MDEPENQPGPDHHGQCPRGLSGAMRVAARSRNLSPPGEAPEPPRGLQLKSYHWPVESLALPASQRARPRAVATSGWPWPRGGRGSGCPEDARWQLPRLADRVTHVRSAPKPAVHARPSPSRPMLVSLQTSGAEPRGVECTRARAPHGETRFVGTDSRHSLGEWQAAYHARATHLSGLRSLARTFLRVMSSLSSFRHHRQYACTQAFNAPASVTVRTTSLSSGWSHSQCEPRPQASLH